MKAALTTLALTLAVAFVHQDADANPPKSRVLTPENYANHSRGSFPREGQWMALRCNKAGCQLAPEHVEIIEDQIPHLDEDLVPVEALLPQNPSVAVFHDLDLGTGMVTTSFWTDRSSYDSGARKSLQKLGVWSTTLGDTTYQLTSVRTATGTMRYHLEGNGLKQLLFITPVTGKHEGDVTPFIRWAGDLDGDGRLDLVVTLPDDNCGFDDRLLLSANAKKGKLVTLAAQSAGRFAACGC
jgi:hypothetical protein